MSDQNSKIKWEEIFNLYNTIKWLYALCEETDTELNTNLQPFNEFRAALDHVMRLIAIENIEEYKGKNAEDEVKKLFTHLRRAFFDICDMLSINYRNKIIDVLEDYTVDEIQSALPDYYSKIRPRIEEISETIASLRTNKRFNGNEEQETALDEYPKIIEELQKYYKTVNSAIPSLLDIKNKNKAKERKNIWIQWVIPIGGLVVGTAVGVIGWFM